MLIVHENLERKEGRRKMDTLSVFGLLVFMFFGLPLIIFFLGRTGLVSGKTIAKIGEMIASGGITIVRSK